ncbi:MAG TPA: DHA2 family efflux MFS transporter permease subunit [Bacillales bacterium]|nr:DHA2 family efflux MFS transporter permease subunit [Bacillales bacterium]
MDEKEWRTISTPTSVSQTETINKTPIVAVLLAGAFVAILNQTLLNTAIPKIMADLSISASQAQWLTTVFMLTNGVMIPVTAFLIERFTTRRLFLTAMSLFAVGTLIAALAPSFSYLLLARIVQASGAGILIPLMQTVFLTIFPREKRGAAMGMVGLVIAFAPAIGPTLSGWLVQTYSWRVLFYVVLPIAIIDIIVAFFVMKNVTRLTYPKVDVFSIILSSFGFGGLLYGFSSAGQSGWGSEKVLISLAIGAVALLIFIFRQLKLARPILEFRVFKYGVFTLATATGMIVFMTMISGELLLPIYMQNMRGYSPLESGLLLLPGAVLMGVMSPISGKLFDKIGARWLAVAGLAIIAAATYGFTNLTADTSFTYLIIVYAIRMFGMALVMMPITTEGLNALPNRLIPHGTAMNNTMRQVAASIGTALLVTVMTNTTKDRIQELASGSTDGLDRAEKLHAAIHGLNVSFFVAVGFAVVGLVLSFFIRRGEIAEEDR